MQRHVRAMLHRLRQVSPVEGGLAPVLDNLVAFWRQKAADNRPMHSMSLLTRMPIGDPTMAAIYRLVQEALNNAVRHGRPRRIEVIVQPVERGEILRACRRRRDRARGRPTYPGSASPGSVSGACASASRDSAGPCTWVPARTAKGFVVTALAAQRGSYGGSVKVLLVDDHAIVRSGLRRLLAALPGAYRSARPQPDARRLAAVRAERPALIMLDLNLPGLGGLELLRRIMVEHPEARVVVLSMHAEALCRHPRPAAPEPPGYLSKNASPEELLEAVRRVARRRALHRGGDRAGAGAAGGRGRSS